MQPQSIAVGFWYFITTSIVGLSCFAFNLYFTLKLHDLCWPNVHAIDYLHKALFVMNLSIPLPKCVAGALRRSRENSEENGVTDNKISTANKFGGNSYGKTHNNEEVIIANKADSVGTRRDDDAENVPNKNSCRV
ncbi:4897_t:CDS:1 [Paraglomus occultum]|uniref:4897_t:CDS:1 n=1 Tax=Paraglomus occultum TaxID=144539 RepID=A0A9N8YXL8_9GLOM|nr:4897_t:CDS:1 [Paraglomus occultum]